MILIERGKPADRDDILILRGYLILRSFLPKDGFE